MKRILISAFSCQPGKGSEPGVGWNWALQCAEQFEVWILTRTKMEPYITPCLPEMLEDRLHFCYTDSSAQLRNLSIYLEYLAWQKAAYRKAQSLCAEIDFDYVWHLTWGNFFLPTDMDRLNVPFIWGPCGAAEQIPMCFWNRLALPERIKHMTKYYLGRHIMRIPWVNRAAIKAEYLIARTTETQELFPVEIQSKTVVHLESVVSDAVFQYPPETKSILHNTGFFNLCYTGRLIGTKNPFALLEAMQAIAAVRNDVRLHIFGDGSLLAHMKNLAVKNDLSGVVQFYGDVSHQEVLRAVASCDAFVFPSLQEGASWSLLEAMFYEKPIVAFDTNGIHDTLSEKCALLAKIVQGDAEQTNRNFVEAVLRLMELPEQEQKAMGRYGKKRLKDVFYADSLQKWLADLLRE